MNTPNTTMPSPTERPAEQHLYAHINATPPLSFSSTFMSGCFPIPYHRIFDLAPEDPHKAVNHHLLRFVTGCLDQGLDHRAILGMVDAALRGWECECDK